MCSVLRALVYLFARVLFCLVASDCICLFGHLRMRLYVCCVFAYVFICLFAQLVMCSFAGLLICVCVYFFV